MNLRVLPQRPVIFLGKPFTLQISVSTGKTEAHSVTLSIVGKTKTSHDFFQDIIRKITGSSESLSSFDHIISKQCPLTPKLQGEKIFCVTVTADNIPPSFDGVYSSISYELVIQSSKLAPVSYPLVFVAQFESETSISHSTGQINIECIEAQSTSSKLYLSCPFSSGIRPQSNDFLVNQSGGMIAKLTIPSAVSVGGTISGWIDLTDSTTGVRELRISLIRLEDYPQDKHEQSEVTAKSIELTGLVGRRFTLTVPYTCTANFSTEIVHVHYSLSFLFSTQDGHRCKWESEIKVLPPEFSITKPRSIQIVK